jgi:hypothetical protein
MYHKSVQFPVKIASDFPCGAYYEKTSAGANVAGLPPPVQLRVEQAMEMV